MSAKRNDPSALGVDDAKTKLARLLETEDELEALLRATKQDAKKLVEEAKRAAAEREKDLEAELAAEDARLRARIESERDQAIDRIRADARSYAEHIDGLEPARIEALVQHVLDRVFGRPGTGDVP